MNLGNFNFVAIYVRKGGVSKMKEVRFAQKSFKSIKNLSICISTP